MDEQVLRWPALFIKLTQLVSDSVFELLAGNKEKPKVSLIVIYIVNIKNKTIEKQGILNARTIEET